MVLTLDELEMRATELKRLADTGRWTVATAESCTGGLLGALITAVPGSSSWYLGGVVSYADDVKRHVLGVAPEVLSTDGAVSRTCALSMVRGVEHLTGARLAVSVTGIAGPDGGTTDKPVGTVWFGLEVSESQAWVFRRRFDGSRCDVRLQSATFVFELLRRIMIGQAPPDEFE